MQNSPHNYDRRPGFHPGQPETESQATDLDWLAFRYISGEMAVSEADQFESLLADDQNARDAVVRAVELSQIVLATQSTPQSESIGLLSAVSKSWMQHLTWVSTSVAALLLVALALNFNRPRTVATSNPDALAAAWLERSGEVAANDPATINGEEEEFVTADPPNWMLEAVRSLHGEGSPESDDASDEEMES
jgi:anti-sigma-K factor RskA